MFFSQVECFVNSRIIGNMHMAFQTVRNCRLLYFNSMVHKVGVYPKGQIQHQKNLGSK